MAIFERLVSTVKRLFQGEMESHVESVQPGPQGNGTNIPAPQSQDKCLPSDFLRESEVSPSAETAGLHSISVPKKGRDVDQSYNGPFIARLKSSRPSLVFRYEADEAIWGTPLELLYISEECHELLQQFNVETIEELADRTQELLEDRRFTSEMRFEIQSQLADWHSHVKELTFYAFGEDNAVDRRPDSHFLLDEEPYSGVSDLVEIPLARKWSEYLPDTPRKDSSEYRHALCYTCDTPLDVLRSLTEDCEQLPLELALQKISEVCEAECMHFGDANVRCIEDHIKAHVRQFDDRWVLKGGILCFHVQPASAYEKSSEVHSPLSSIQFRSPIEERDSTGLLPTKVTSEVAVATDPTESIGDEKARLKAAAAKPGSISSPPCSYTLDSKEIRSLLLKSNLPMKAEDILAHFHGRVSADEIRGILIDREVFEEIEEGCYTIVGWQADLGADELMAGLPETIRSFLLFLTTKNNSSYKLVLASIFLREMDENGFVPLSRLRSEMYAYYKARKDHGLIIEAEGLTAAQIDEIEPDEFQHKVLRHSLGSFLNSQYFLISEKCLGLSAELHQEISNHGLLGCVLSALKRSLECYFKLIAGQTPHGSTLATDPGWEVTKTSSNSGQEVIGLTRPFDDRNKKAGLIQPSIAIRKKRRSKIQL